MNPGWTIIILLVKEMLGRGAELWGEALAGPNL